MSYDALNSEGKKRTPRVRCGTAWHCVAHSAMGLFSFSGAGFGLVTATARPVSERTTQGREGA